jgi:hypothetical protein
VWTRHRVAVRNKRIINSARSGILFHTPLAHPRQTDNVALTPKEWWRTGCFWPVSYICSRGLDWPPCDSFKNIGKCHIFKDSLPDITLHTLRRDFNIPYVSDVIHERINKHHNKLEAHPIPLLEPLLQPVNTRRLKRCWFLDLQGIWADIAGWIAYHVVVIHGIVEYFV